MNSRILKLELFGLFLVTLISFMAFYYIDVLPDNYFSISSKSSSYNFLTYYLTSFMAFIGYFTGPWIFFPFFIFCFFYAFLYSKRDFGADLFNIVFLLGFFLFVTNSFFPIFLGTGTAYLLNKFIPSGISILLVPLFAFGFLATSFREKFFKTIKNSYKYLADKSKNIKLPEVKLPKREKNTGEEIPKTPKAKGPFAAASNKRMQEVPRPKNLDEEKYFKLMATVAKKRSKKSLRPPAEDYFNDITSSIESKLGEFKIEGEIINVLKGPVVDTFELELGPGVKVSKITNHAQDLSLALYGIPIRIVYPMKGRSTVGIEVPRNPREIIYLGDILHSDEFKNSSYTLPISMGKDAFGVAFVANLANMPHMLVAGATGAGKSVFINSLLFSLLIKRSPKELKLILIDPKQLELALYTDLPHLAMPVVTSASQASQALHWATAEMERRYSILKKFGVRNIEGFNEKMESASKDMMGEISDLYPPNTKNFELPYLVIVIDEFADLILTKCGKDIENNVCRIAAKARAAGIHLVLATQRPSVDVITGLIKSNFPTRVSFRVTTSIDSRTILSAQGAELLLGKGDMLYKSGIETVRVHGAFVTEDEIEDLAKKLKTFDLEFDPSALNFLEKSDEEPGGFSIKTDSESEDELFDQAVKVVVEHKQASASMLQRRLKIGYNRAANLIEEMESKGIVGATEGAKPRKVLPGADEFLN
jgi:S-DNA-T family DNA segregation ATPase FtsK/SpoIIIE